jgi:hypothetical protein
MFNFFKKEVSEKEEGIDFCYKKELDLSNEVLTTLKEQLYKKDVSPGQIFFSFRVISLLRAYPAAKSIEDFFKYALKDIEEKKDEDIDSLYTCHLAFLSLPEIINKLEASISVLKNIESQLKKLDYTDVV